MASGDQLILQNNQDTAPEDKLSLNIHLTMTGQPEDSQFIDKIEVSKEYTLRDLKDVILSMKQFEFAKDFVSIIVIISSHYFSLLNKSELERSNAISSLVEYCVTKQEINL